MDGMTRRNGRAEGELAAKDGIRIVIVEPQEVMRDGLALVLGSEQGFEIVGVAAGAEEAVAVASSVLPDVMVMELALPGSSGLATVRRLVALHPAPRVVVLSTYRLKDEVTAVFEAGARGCISKDGGSQTLVEGIRAVHRGELFMSPKVSDLVMRAYASSPGRRDVDAMPTRSLTPRECEVLKLISYGKTDRETAALLKLSVKTVHTHRMNIMGKLGAHNVTILIRRAIQLGMVDL